MSIIRILAILFLSAAASLAGEPASQPAAGVDQFPGIHIDVKNKQIRVDSEEIDCKAPLEFFSVVNGTNEHESVLRTKAQPSKIHLGLLMLGLEPGEGVKYSEAAKKWFPPHGPPLKISCEFVKDGKKVVVPAYRMMRDLKTKKSMPPMTWIFVGSRVMEDGHYAADVTGYVVSVVNFELTLIDIPDLASSANETLEWEIDTDVAPPGGTPVTMIIEPAGSVESPAAQPTAECITSARDATSERCEDRSGEGRSPGAALDAESRPARCGVARSGTGAVRNHHRASPRAATIDR